MGKPKEDEIPLLEPNLGRKFNRQRIRPTLTLPLKKDYESIKYKIQEEDSLDVSHLVHFLTHNFSSVDCSSIRSWKRRAKKSE